MFPQAEFTYFLEMVKHTVELSIVEDYNGKAVSFYLTAMIVAGEI